MHRCCTIITVLISVWALLPSHASAQQNPLAADSIRINIGQNATIGLIAGGSGSTDARIAADIANVLDDGDKLRVLPILGQGSVQNIADLIYLKGIDVAIVHADVLTETMQQGIIPRESSVQYIAKLFQEEIHVLARKDINSIADLNGKMMSTGVLGSGTDLTGTAILAHLHVTPSITHESSNAALVRLRRGDIAAMFVIGGKPVPMLQGIEPGTGLHFLPIPLNTQLINDYVPTTLDHQQYPSLVPAGPSINTVAVSSVLITLSTPADSARAKRINHFVDVLFERFDRFHQPAFHPKWQEVNLSAQIQGWTRYPQAQSQLKKDQPAGADLKTSFDTYLTQSGQTTFGMTNDRREALFREFVKWRDQRSPP